MGQKLEVAGRSADGGGGTAAPGPSQRLGSKRADAVDDGPVHGFVPHHAPAADLRAPGFKLWFYEGNDISPGSQNLLYGRENLLQGDKRDVNSGQRRPGREGSGIEAACIDAFHHPDPGIPAKAPMELPLAHVHGVDEGRPVLEQAIRKAPGGGPDIRGDAVPYGKLEGLDGPRQLVAAPADIGIGSLDLQGGIPRNLEAGFFQNPVSRTDLAGPDQPLGPFAAFREPPLNEQAVQSDFSRRMHGPRSVGGARRKVPEKHRPLWPGDFRQKFADSVDSPPRLVYFALNSDIKGPLYGGTHGRSGVLKLSKRVEYGLIALLYMDSLDQGSLAVSRDIAEQFRLPAGLLGKVLQTLAREGVVESVHGAHGGYRLTRPLEEISVGQVLNAIEGPVHLTRCQEDPEACGLSGHCTIQSPLHRIQVEISDYIHGLRLSAFREERQSEPLKVLT